MKHSLLFPVRTLGALLPALLAGFSAFAQSGAAYYSTFENPVLNSTYAVSSTGDGLCLGCFVANPERAADTDINNYAVVQNSLGVVGGGVALNLRLNGAGLANYRAGVVISTGSLLNVSTLATLTLRTSLNGIPQEEVKGSDAIVSTRLLADSRYGVEFGASKAFDKVELVVGGLLNGINTVRVLYAYAVPAATQLDRAVGYISRSAQPAAGDYVVRSGGGSPLAVCVGTGVTNPENTVDADLDNFATLNTVAGVNGCTTALQVKLDGLAPAGYQAGFVVGNGSLLDLNVLDGLQLTTYLNGVQQETRRGADLLTLTLLPDNRYQVSFKSTAAFNQVELQQGALVSALNTLQVYYGFGIEPRAFRDVTPVLSNFTAPQRGTEFQESAGGLLCLGCNSYNTARAADNVFTPGDYAGVQFPVLALGTYRLKLRLNGSGKGGDRAGIVLRTNKGLLNTTLLQNIRINTYSGINGTQLEESASGSSLLDLGLISDNRRSVAFLTKRNFDWVEVELTGGVGLFSDARIYYAFAEDPNPGFPAVVGPPVIVPPGGGGGESELRVGRGSGFSSSSDALDLFPNPAAGVRQVEISLATPPTAGSRVQVYTTLGQLVRNVAVTERTVQLSTTGLGAGLYHVVLLNGSGQRVASKSLLLAER
ncbi:T9SS type A sorting domain-containing protein [Hymenobacter aquaticus]|uniref:T9SS type A sorting domain-containing protein n=1 Tax=Hymenobacter aquaticus TaxID=1867101 RepID=A0A4Z0PV72_9BACT|nr:T9SS type A sorting domain-containing protein [Hymenobacter aquaticus]TGE21638.1 T9SS type A sorting domain-containing protein [Hymenobacter aquaticus]